MNALNTRRWPNGNPFTGGFKKRGKKSIPDSREAELAALAKFIEAEGVKKLPGAGDPALPRCQAFKNQVKTLQAEFERGGVAKL